MKKTFALIMLFTCLIGLMTGCSKEEYVVEYGIDGYVYPSRRLHTLDAVQGLRVLGDYLYYMEISDGKTFVKRVSVAAAKAGEGKPDFSASETLTSFKSMVFELPEDGESNEETYFFAALDGELKQSSWSDMEKKYGRLTLDQYAPAPDGGVYYYLRASVGEYYSGDTVGGILCRQNSEGTLLYRIYLPELLDFTADTKGNIFALTQDAIQVLDPDGTSLGTIATEASNMLNEGMQDLFSDSESRIYYTFVDKQYKRTTYEIDSEKSFQLKKTDSILGEGSGYYFAATDGNIFQFRSDSEGALYLYDRESASRKKLLSWYESGLMSTGIQEVAAITSDLLLVSYSGTFGGSSGIYLLTKTAVADLPEKEMLVIASPVSSFELQKAVMLFNATNSSYRVVLDTYNAEFSDEELKWLCPLLDASLVSNNPPDILNLGVLSVDKYARKGILEDQFPFLEHSTILDKEDIPDNVLEGLTYDGKLTCIPLSIEVNGIGARASQVENIDNWTMEDVYRLTDEHPESIGGMLDDGGYGSLAEGDWLLKHFCAYYYLEKFVDWDKRECNFDSDDFRQLIAWAGKYGCTPKHVEQPVGDIYLDRIYLPESVLLVPQYYLNFTSLMVSEIQFGEEVCLKGYPTADGSNYFPGLIRGGLGVTSVSSHKEGAWEFLEYYFDVNSQLLFGDLPASKSKIQEDYEDKTIPTYIEGATDENGNPVMRSKGIIFGITDYMDYYYVPKEQADAVMNALESADFRPMPEEKEQIIRIVAEEAKSYFRGDKTLGEVTKIIQNRAQILLDETKTNALF